MKKEKMEKMIQRQNQKWLDPKKFNRQQCLNHKPLNKCPECHGQIEYSTEDEDEAYCTECGLIVSASIAYVAGFKIDLPYGLRL